MAKRSGPRTVQCYLCRRRFEVGAMAESTSCPGCHKPVFVGDVIVKQLKPVTMVQTCGRLVIKRQGRVIAKTVEAHLGIEVLGILDAHAISGGPVVIGAKAAWKGDCRAPCVSVKAGAKVDGYFTVPEDSLGLSDLHAANARRKKR